VHVMFVGGDPDEARRGIKDQLERRVADLVE
jgi:hypothetical protein